MFCELNIISDFKYNQEVKDYIYSVCNHLNNFEIFEFENNFKDNIESSFEIAFNLDYNNDDNEFNEIVSRLENFELIEKVFVDTINKFETRLSHKIQKEDYNKEKERLTKKIINKNLKLDVTDSWMYKYPGHSGFDDLYYINLLIKGEKDKNEIKKLEALKQIAIEEELNIKERYIYNEELNKISKEKALEKVDTIVDGLNKGIDNDIKIPVAGFIRQGIKTNGSCEGHSDWGLPYPWISIELSDKFNISKILDERFWNYIYIQKYHDSFRITIDARKFGAKKAFDRDLKSYNAEIHKKQLEKFNEIGQWLLNN